MILPAPTPPEISYNDVVLPAAFDPDRLAVGASILATREVRERMFEIYENAHLLNYWCRRVDAWVRRMHSNGMPVDQALVWQFADRMGELEDGPTRADLGSWLFDLAGQAPTPAAGTFYALAVIEAAARRAVASAGDMLLRVAFTGSLEDVSAVATVATVDAVKLVERVRAVAA